MAARYPATRPRALTGESAVSIIGLYTNVLEGPAVISSEQGHSPVLAGDTQLAFLRAELKRLATELLSVRLRVIPEGEKPDREKLPAG
jgi:hypothetical protein